MAACKSCDAPIRWAKSKTTGRPMPLDVEPSEEGNLVIVREGAHGITEEVARAATDEDRKLLRPMYLSHFVTCPQAASWRNPKN